MLECLDIVDPAEDTVEFVLDSVTRSPPNNEKMIVDSLNNTIEAVLLSVARI